MAKFKIGQWVTPVAMGGDPVYASQIKEVDKVGILWWAEYRYRVEKEVGGVVKSVWFWEWEIVPMIDDDRR